LQVCANISRPLDLEAFAELHVGSGDDDLLQFALALKEWQLSEVSAVQVE